MAPRPDDLIYAVDERPPPLRLVLLGLHQRVGPRGRVTPTDCGDHYNRRRRRRCERVDLLPTLKTQPADALRTAVAYAVFKTISAEPPLR